MLKILVPVGEGRSKGYSVLPDHCRHPGVVDIMMFSLLIPIEGLPLGFKLILSARVPAGRQFLRSPIMLHLHYRGWFNVLGLHKFLNRTLRVYLFYSSYIDHKDDLLWKAGKCNDERVGICVKRNCKQWLLSDPTESENLPIPETQDIKNQRNKSLISSGNFYSQDRAEFFGVGSDSGFRSIKQGRVRALHSRKYRFRAHFGPTISCPLPLFFVF